MRRRGRGGDLGPEDLVRVYGEACAEVDRVMPDRFDSRRHLLLRDLLDVEGTDAVECIIARHWLRTGRPRARRYGRR